MSAMLYQINIMDVSPAERRVRLTVAVAYFDGYMNIRLPEAGALGFFLQVLADPSGSSTGKLPFYTEQLGLEKVFDFKWALKNAYHYIERVERLWIENDDRASYMRCFDAINRGEDIPSDAYVEAEYAVTVTDPTGLSHLSPRTGWGTTVWSSGDRSVVLKVDEEHRAVLPDLSSPLHTIDFEYEGASHPIYFSKDGARMLVGTYPSRNVLTFDTSDWKLIHTNQVTKHTCYLAFDNHLERYWAKPSDNYSGECWTFGGQRAENVELPSFGVYATEVCEDNDDEDWDGIEEFRGNPKIYHWFHLSPSGSYYCILDEYGPSGSAIVLYDSRGEPLWHRNIDLGDASILAWSQDESRIAYRCNDQHFFMRHGEDYADPVLVLDAQTGDLVASIELGVLDIMSLRFDPSNRYLAVVGIVELYVYHLESRKKVLHYGISEVVDPGTLVSMHWVPGSESVVISYQCKNGSGTIQVFPLLSPAGG